MRVSRRAYDIMCGVRASASSPHAKLTAGTQKHVLSQGVGVTYKREPFALVQATNLTAEEQGAQFPTWYNRKALGIFLKSRPLLCLNGQEHNRLVQADVPRANGPEIFESSQNDPPWVAKRSSLFEKLS